MKKITTLFFMMLIASIIFAQVPKGTMLYNNGPFVTNPGVGPGGTDFSVLVTPHVNFGFGCGKGAFIRVADDFPLTDINWHIDSIILFAYQTGAPSTSSPFTAFTIRIWNGNPATGTVVWGDTVTNVLTSSYFSGVYRSQDLVATSTTRAIYRNVCTTTGLTLTTGNYWLDWQAVGNSSYSGPWVPPITVTGQDVTGNAMQFITGSWNAAKDSSSATSVLPQGFPFIIYGTKTASVDELDNESTFNMFPNPVKNELTLNVSSIMKNVKVYDILGQIVFNNDVNAKSYKVNTSQLVNGAYFVQVETNKGLIRKKFIVNQ